MKHSEELVKKAGILPRLRLGEKTPKGVTANGPHLVKLLEDKIVIEKDPKTGNDLEFVKYIVEEKGIKKFYKTKLRGSDGMPSYLVQALSEFQEGDEVILEMKKNGVKNYVSVSSLNNHGDAEIEDEEEEMSNTEEIIEG